MPDVVGIDRAFDYVVPTSWEADGRAEWSSWGRWFGSCSQADGSTAGSPPSRWSLESGVRLVELVNWWMVRRRTARPGRVGGVALGRSPGGLPAGGPPERPSRPRRTSASCPSRRPREQATMRLTGVATVESHPMTTAGCCPKAVAAARCPDPRYVPSRHLPWRCAGRGLGGARPRRVGGGSRGCDGRRHPVSRMDADAGSRCRCRDRRTRRAVQGGTHPGVARAGRSRTGVGRVCPR